MLLCPLSYEMKLILYEYINHVYDVVGFRRYGKPVLPYRLLFNAWMQAVAQCEVLRRACRMRHGYVAFIRCRPTSLSRLNAAVEPYVLPLQFKGPFTHRIRSFVNKDLGSRPRPKPRTRDIKVKFFTGLHRTSFFHRWWWCTCREDNEFFGIIWWSSSASFQQTANLPGLTDLRCWSVCMAGLETGADKYWMMTHLGCASILFVLILLQSKERYKLDVEKVSPMEGWETGPENYRKCFPLHSAAYSFHYICGN